MSAAHTVKDDAIENHYFEGTLKWNEWNGMDMDMDNWKKKWW